MQPENRPAIGTACELLSKLPTQLPAVSLTTRHTAARIHSRSAASSIIPREHTDEIPELSDRRVLLAALAVATTDSRSAEERRSALDVVAQLYWPGHSISNLWNTPVQNRIGISARYDFSQFTGAQPITAADRTSVLNALDILNARSATSDLCGMAKWLAAELRRMP